MQLKSFLLPSTRPKGETKKIKQEEGHRKYPANPCPRARTVWDSKPPKAGDPINWVELKTSAEMRNDRDRDNFERKLLKFWIQSFLLGVPRIIVGFRSRDGVLQRVEDMDVASIPDTVARRGRQWDGNICTNFATSFLECESVLLYSGLFWSQISSSPPPLARLRRKHET